MLSALKTLPQNTLSNFTWGRYILIVGAALILALMLYGLLDGTDANGDADGQALALSDSETEALAGIEPAHFQQISEFKNGETQRLRLSGKAQPNSVVVITNKGERLRQVGVDDQGQWVVSLTAEDGLMVLKAQIYMDEDAPAIRSEETVFRLSVPKDESGPEAARYKTSALIMVTAPGRPSRVIQSPFGESPSSGPLSLSVIDYDSNGGIIITGTSSVPGRVRLYAQNTVIGETGIGVGGRWNFIAGRMLPRTKISLTAELIPAQGTPNAPQEPSRISIPFNFIPPLKEEDTEGSGALSVNIEPQQWQIRRTLIGGGGQSTVVFAPDILVPVILGSEASELGASETDVSGLATSNPDVTE